MIANNINKDKCNNQQNSDSLQKSVPLKINGISDVKENLINNITDKLNKVESKINDNKTSDCKNKTFEEMKRFPTYEEMPEPDELTWVKDMSKEVAIDNEPHCTQLLKDKLGNEYIFKAATEKEKLNKNTQVKLYLAYIQLSGYKVQSIVDPETAVPVKCGMVKIKDYKGRDVKVFGAYQYKVPNCTNLTVKQVYNKEPKIIEGLIREHITDWLLCNFDNKADNFLVNNEGTLIGIDKEQSLKYIAMDFTKNMSIELNPASPIFNVYSYIFKAVKNKQIDIKTVKTILEKYISRVENYDNKDYGKIFADYVYHLLDDCSITDEEFKKYYKNYLRTIMNRKKEMIQQYENFLQSLYDGEEKICLYKDLNEYDYKFYDDCNLRSEPSKNDDDFDNFSSDIYDDEDMEKVEDNMFWYEKNLTYAPIVRHNKVAEYVNKLPIFNQHSEIIKSYGGNVYKLKDGNCRSGNRPYKFTVARSKAELQIPDIVYKLRKLIFNDGPLYYDIMGILAKLKLDGVVRYGTLFKCWGNGNRLVRSDVSSNKDIHIQSLLSEHVIDWLLGRENVSFTSFYRNNFSGYFNASKTILSLNKRHIFMDNLKDKDIKIPADKNNVYTRLFDVLFGMSMLKKTNITNALDHVISNVEKIDDDEYKKIFVPYVKFRCKTEQKQNEMLELILDRKRNVREAYKNLFRIKLRILPEAMYIDKERYYCNIPDSIQNFENAQLRYKEDVSKELLADKITQFENSMRFKDDLKYIFDNHDFCMAISLMNLQKVFNNGRFGNFFELKVTRGATDYEIRSYTESIIMGALDNCPHSQRAKYGYLDFMAADDRIKRAYGECTVVFKKDRIKNRTTFYYGDTVNCYCFGYTGLVSLVEDPKFNILSRDETPNVKEDVQKWLTEMDRARTSINNKIIEYISNPSWGFGDFWSNVAPFNTVRRNIFPYIELHYHGKLDINDIERININLEGRSLHNYYKLISGIKEIGIPIYINGKRY